VRHARFESHCFGAIYDLSGRLVRSLVDANIGPGTYQAAWDGWAEGGERVKSASGWPRVFWVQGETRQPRRPGAATTSHS